MNTQKLLTVSHLKTIQGPMIAISDESSLYLLEFVDRRNLEKEVNRLTQNGKLAVSLGTTSPITQIEKELNKYFRGEIKEFKTPLILHGTPFQKKVWEALKSIPLGQTKSYAEIACALNRPTAVRAVAQAISKNQLAVIIPCHRVINSDGQLGGYSGGIIRKKWLLDHESKVMNGQYK